MCGLTVDLSPVAVLGDSDPALISEDMLREAKDEISTDRFTPVTADGRSHLWQYYTCSNDMRTGTHRLRINVLIK